MRIVHIAGGFAQQALYPNLIGALMPYCAWQSILAPVRTAEEKQRQPNDVPGVVEYHFEHILRRYHRIFFRQKISAIYELLTSRVDIQDCQLIHAHTLYSDGAVALRANEREGIPYVVSFRNTDLNVFMRYRRDLRGIGHRVLEKAERVVFLSPSYREALNGRLKGEFRQLVADKSVVVPNGLPASWLDGYGGVVRRASDELRLLYVGEFSKNKNVRNVLAAASILSRKRKIRLTLVGGGGDDEKRIRRDINRRRYSFAQCLGRITDRQRLRGIYLDNDVFVMPSWRETFGIVYLEALSQGLPVVHSRGQGVDGLFEVGTVSEAVSPGSSADIAAGIEALAARLPDVSARCIAEARKYSWSNIAERYAEVYSSARRSRAESQCPAKLIGHDRRDSL